MAWLLSFFSSWPSSSVGSFASLLLGTGNFNAADMDKDKTKTKNFQSCQPIWVPDSDFSEPCDLVSVLLCDLCK